MTAATVPPHGWAPIGARELQKNSRRHLRFGLTLSGASHVLVLGAILWSQAGERVHAPRWNAAPIDLYPTPTIEHIPLPGHPPEVTGVTSPPDDGLPTLVDDVTRVTLPSSPPIQGKTPDEPGDAASGATPGVDVLPSVGDDDPPETAVIPHETVPVPTFSPKPKYPEWARDAGIEGTVIFHVLVGRDGRVRRVVVKRDVMGLTDCARSAIAGWVFRPATYGGKPVAVWVEVPFAFKLP